MRDSLTSTMPTYPKMQLFNKKSTTGVRSVKILRTSHPPYSDAFIKMADPDYYPSIRETFHILLTMPMGSVPCEHSFSSLRRLKQWNRTTMVEDRLNGLALLHIHRYVNVDRVKILDKIGALHL